MGTGIGKRAAKARELLAASLLCASMVSCSGPRMGQVQDSQAGAVSPPVGGQVPATVNSAQESLGLERPTRPGRTLVQPLFVFTEGTAGGTVSSNPAGINCPSLCVSNYGAGASVTLTATPQGGAVFGGWEGACSGTGTCTVVMNSAQTVIADFEFLPPKFSTAAPAMSFLPSSFDFGTVQNGTTLAKTVQMSNTGPAAGGDLIVSGATVNNPLFKVPATQFPLTVAPGSSVTLTVTFSPQVSGSSNALVTFTSNASNPSAALTLLGKGGATTSAPALNVSPLNLFFGNVMTGSTLTQTLTMSNPGTGNTTVFAGTVSGSGFSIVSPTFPLVLTPGTTQVVTIQFAPQSAGAVTGVITFTSNATSTPVLSLIAAGNATSPVTSAALFPTAMDFGIVPLGSTRVLTEVVYNTGNTPLTVYGANPIGTGFGTDLSSYPATIPVNGSKAFTITFTAFAAGQASGTVTFSTNATAGNPVLNVTATSASPSAHSVNLSWSASPSTVIGYNVYRSMIPSTAYQKLSFTTTTTFLDSAVAGGTQYYYVISAVAASGKESTFSNQAVAAIP